MALLIEPAPYGGPLIEEVQQEYVRRYGSPDETPVADGEFTPPRGVFLIASLDGDPAACGGFRMIEPGVGELKRMYVAPRARRRGLARQVLAALEEHARASGCTELRLETGTGQPEAIALYQSSGYFPCPPFGHYRCSPLARAYVKTL